MDLVQEIIRIGRLLWDKSLVTGFNGNISARLDADTILITATGTCLGYLKPDDVIKLRLNGEVIGQGKASTEKLMHTEIYKNFTNTQAVLHTHPTYTNGFFLANESFSPKTFEARFYLGEVKSVPQTTPSVTDMAPVIKELKASSIVVLREHGVVAMSTDLFNAFVLIQELEEQVKMDLVRVHYAGKNEYTKSAAPAAGTTTMPAANSRKYKLFSSEQIAEIVRLVNNDAQMKELGVKTAMNMDLAVCLQETGDVFSFKFKDGKIVETGKDEGAEFLITANDTIWRAVFNREIDPFVATTQKKMNLRGDFARISKWYAPCSRIFQLWSQVPVE